MTYKQLKEKYPNHRISEDMFIRINYEIKGEDYLPINWELALDQSCDEWVIGSLADAKRFEYNLKIAMSFIDNNPIDNE